MARIERFEVAKGSAAEVKSLLYNALDLGYIMSDEFEKLLHDASIVGMMISSLMTYLKKSRTPPLLTNQPTDRQTD